MLPFAIIQAVQLVLIQGSECFSEAGVEKKKNILLKEGGIFLYTGSHRACEWD